MEEQLTKQGFYDLWIQQVRKGFGYMQAYENAEIIHVKRFGKERYSCYQSFAKVRDTK